jgi:pyridoxine 5-phosphate synthase
MKLGVNIDHIATLRQARYATTPEAPNVEPDLAIAAALCERGGASGITMHLRADRRHIQDRDVRRLRETINTKLNLELGNTPEIVDIALAILPEEVCLVPENRAEITTEGGLDAVVQKKALESTVRRLQSGGIRVSLFIEPSPSQIEAAAALRAEVIELHTGAFANAIAAAREGELKRLRTAAEHAHGFGLQVNAGHGLNYANVREIAAVPYLAELNIGHSIVCRAMFVGLQRATAEMFALLNPAGTP